MANQRTNILVVAGVAGAGFGLLIALVAMYLLYAKPLISLDASTLQEMEKRWSDADVTDYNLIVEVTLREPSIYKIQVRDRQVQSMTHNDKPIEKAHVQQTWTVPGMFATLRTDLERKRKQELENRDNIVLRVEFDPDLGFPKRVLRIERHEMGANPEAKWEVTEFQVIDKQEPPR